MSEAGFKPTTSVFEEYKIVHASIHIKSRHSSMSEAGFKPTTSVFEEYKIVHASIHINHTTTFCTV